MKPNPPRILRSPIFHFAVAGLLLFALATYLGVGRGGGERAGGCGEAGRGDDARTICVERDALFAFIQTQTQAARIEDVAAAFDAAEDRVRRDWIDRFVREEALVREARALRLDEADPLIRRRLVQQMEFLFEESEGGGEITDAEIEAAYRAHRSDYHEPATLRFAHVFIREGDGKRAGKGAGTSAGTGAGAGTSAGKGASTGVAEAGRADPARGGGKGGVRLITVAERVAAIRDALNDARVPFDGGYAYGDRFLYDRTYVDRNLDEVRSHFGDAFVTALEGLEPNGERWIGPIRSVHGLHLVLLTGKRPERQASLEEVRADLVERLRRERRERAVEQGVAAIVGNYEVVIGPGIGAEIAGAGPAGPGDGAGGAPTAPVPPAAAAAR